jgi:excisionase family DNA binding protein
MTSYSVREVASLLKVRTHAILGLIRNGSLRAIDVSQVQGGRPRWRILGDDLEGFLARRTHQPAVVGRRRRKVRTTGMKEYF